MSESQSDGPSSSTITHAVSNRPEMVEAARKFFTNPKVRSTPFQEQKQFLFDKGVTSAEIDEALASISPVEVAASSSPNAVVVNHPVSSQNKLVTLTQSVVMIGGVSYMAYKLVRSWVLPRFFGVPDPADEQMQNLQTQINELQNSTKFIMDSVEQTLQTVSAQQEQLNRALLMMHSGGKESDLHRLQTDIAIIKSLLLNQNQFPAIPASSNGHSILNGHKKDNNRSVSFAEQVPSWQLEHDSANPNESNDTDSVNGEV